MNNENKTIHEFDFNFICDFFSSLERQGPGSPEATLKALSFIDNLIDKSLIADIGCGTGGQTMILAQHTPGDITGLDLFPGLRPLKNLSRFNDMKLSYTASIKSSMAMRFSSQKR